ncbi:methionyl-tRNA formyltransferase [Egicoccus sp. AB-alg6-2]|uniref:methionyl-tRNA formyltransferase n=1 Tax=Egicoccus sp. AB-alg6-2 TaxID=3242692 RepID=UPI00359D786D
MRVAFLGTPDVAVPALRSLVAATDLEVAAVVTNPDRPKGRSRSLVAPPVKVAAQELGLEVWQPVKPAEVLDELAALELDACAVVAYGALLPQRVLDVGGAGFVNLHFSLLPRWRGAAPVQHALRAGDTVTGITTFVLDKGMDTGPVLDRVEVPIQPDESAGELLTRLAELGGPVLVDSLRRLVAGEVPVPQPAEGATLAPKIEPDDVRIDWTRPAREIKDLVRSAEPAPGAHTTFRGKRLKVRAVDVVEADAASPGTVLERTADGVVVATAADALVLRRVQPEGKQAMDGAAFANGYRPDPGERLGADTAA